MGKYKAGSYTSASLRVFTLEYAHALLFPKPNTGNLIVIDHPVQ